MSVRHATLSSAVSKNDEKWVHSSNVIIFVSADETRDLMRLVNVTHPPMTWKANAMLQRTSELSVLRTVLKTAVTIKSSKNNCRD